MLGLTLDMRSNHSLLSTNNLNITSLNTTRVNTGIPFNNPPSNSIPTRLTTVIPSPASFTPKVLTVPTITTPLAQAPPAHPTHRCGFAYALPQGILLLFLFIVGSESEIVSGRETADETEAEIMNESESGIMDGIESMNGTEAANELVNPTTTAPITTTNSQHEKPDVSDLASANLQR